MIGKSSSGVSGLQCCCRVAGEPRVCAWAHSGITQLKLNLTNPSLKPNSPGWDETELPQEKGTWQSWTWQGPTQEKEASRARMPVGLSKPRQPLPPGPALAVLETAQ